MRRSCCVLAALFVASSHVAASAVEREEIVIDAAEMAPSDLRSETPVAGKWWLNRKAKEWGASKGTILMTGEPTGNTGKDGLHKVTPADRFVPYRVPAFEVDRFHLAS